MVVIRRDFSIYIESRIFTNLLRIFEFEGTAATVVGREISIYAEISRMITNLLWISEFEGPAVTVMGCEILNLHRNKSYEYSIKVIHFFSHNFDLLGNLLNRNLVFVSRWIRINGGCTEIVKQMDSAISKEVKFVSWNENDCKHMNVSDIMFVWTYGLPFGWCYQRIQTYSWWDEQTLLAWTWLFLPGQ